MVPWWQEHQAQASHGHQEPLSPAGEASVPGGTQAQLGARVSKPYSAPYNVGPSSQPALRFQCSFAAPPPFPPLLHGEGHLPAPILGEDSNLCSARLL